MSAAVWTMPNGAKNLQHGQIVSLVFRPEDVRLARGNERLWDCYHRTTGVVKEVVSAGAYERLSVQLDFAEAAIVVTRLKANTPKLRIGDHVRVGLTSYTVLTPVGAALRGRPSLNNARDGRPRSAAPTKWSDSSWN